MALRQIRTLIFLLSFYVHKTVGVRDLEYYMDNFSDCGRTVNVDESGVKIYARSMVAPSNPPLTCIIYLQSSYTRDDGSNKLQIEVDYLNIKDCNINLDIFNGRKSAGAYLRAMSCQQKPVDIIYSNSNKVTVRFTRPTTLTNTEYRFSLTIKPWKDWSVLVPDESDEKLSIAAIIGIVIGCLVVIAVLILVCWCCCTGRLSGKFGQKYEKSVPAHVNRGLAEEKFKAPALVLNHPAVWSTNTGGANDRFQPRYFQRGNPRNDMMMGDRGRNGPDDRYRNDNDRLQYERRQGEGGGYYGNNQRPRPREPEYGHNYEPYNEYDNKRNETNTKPNPSPKASPKSSPKQQQRQPPPQPRKETLIDDVFDSDSNSHTSDFDDATLQKRPITDYAESSPKSKRKSQPIPEEEDIDRSPQLARYKSMDLQSQPDTDTITSPIHINAGVRASVEDDLGGSPVGSLRKKKGPKSPQTKRRGGRDPDSAALPPEAFEPIFTGEPISGINYSNNQYPPGYGQMMPQFPGGFMPYGMMPQGAFGAPGVPGAQTYAYAYQTVPQGAGPGGQPATQGAFVVHNTPTADGNRRTAYAVEETASPDRAHYGKRGNNSDPFARTPYRDSGASSKKGGGRGRDKGKNGYAPDLSVVTRGAAPPDPGQGHRSVALKSGTDPNTGIHTVQGVWTDTVADPTDPGPGEDNPQITRKTITRVTTKSGYNELPPESDPLIALEAEPAFLNPSSRPSHNYNAPAIMPAYSPSSPPRNIDFYTGSTLPPPERSSTPTSTPRALPTHHGVIRDRIPFDDSTV